MLRDNVDPGINCNSIVAEDSITMDQGTLVGLLVAIVQITPIATVMAAKVVFEIDAQSNRPRGCDCPSQSKARRHEVVRHRSVCVIFLSEFSQADSRIHFSSTAIFNRTRRKTIKSTLWDSAHERVKPRSETRRKGRMQQIPHSSTMADRQ